MKPYFLLFFILIAVIFSFMQFLDISVFGVQPNFSIIAISAIALLVPEIWEGILIVSLSSFILKFSPHFSSEIFIFFITGILIILLAKYLPWHHSINNLFLIFIYTLVFYLFLVPTKIISAEFLQEVFYNILIGSLVFLLMPKTFKH